MANKQRFISFRVDDEEGARLDSLAGEMKTPEFVAHAAFSKRKFQGNSETYPGWEIAEQGRRDRGIRISHPKHEPVLLYPEDKEYSRFAEM